MKLRTIPIGELHIEVCDLLCNCKTCNNEIINRLEYTYYNFEKGFITFNYKTN